MSDKVKIALIAAAAAVGITWMVMHYSPYQTCVRARADAEVAFSMRVVDVTRTPVPMPEDEARRIAEIACAGAE